MFTEQIDLVQWNKILLMQHDLSNWRLGVN